MAENLVQDRDQVEALLGVHDHMDGVENGLESQLDPTETQESTPEDGGFVALKPEDEEHDSTGVLGLVEGRSDAVDLGGDSLIKRAIRSAAKPFVAGVAALSLITSPAVAASTQKSTKPASKSAAKTTKTTRRPITKTGTTGQAGTTKVSPNAATTARTVPVTAKIAPTVVDPEFTWTDLSPLIPPNDNISVAEVVYQGHDMVAMARSECLDIIPGSTQRDTLKRTPIIAVSVEQRVTRSVLDPASTQHTRATQGTTIAVGYKGEEKRRGSIGYDAQGTSTSLAYIEFFSTNPGDIQARHEFSINAVKSDGTETKLGTLALTGLACPLHNNATRPTLTSEAMDTISDYAAGLVRDPKTHRIVNYL